MVKYSSSRLLAVLNSELWSEALLDFVWTHSSTFKEFVFGLGKYTHSKLFSILYGSKLLLWNT